MAKPSPDIRKEEREAAYAIACRYAPELASRVTLEKFVADIDTVRRKRGRPPGTTKYPEDEEVLCLIAFCQLVGDPREPRDILAEILSHSRAQPNNRILQKYDPERYFAIARKSGLSLRQKSSGELIATPASPEPSPSFPAVRNPEEWAKIWEEWAKTCADDEAKMRRHGLWPVIK
jgi:hypothetical protein